MSIKNQSLFSTELLENPYEAYRCAHVAAPIAYDASQSSWVLVKYRDAEFVLKDPKLFSSKKHLNTMPGEGGLGLNMMLLSHDPPEHTQLRSLVQKAFTSAHLKKLEGWIDEQVDAMLDGMNEGEMDVSADLCIPLPIKVMTRILGLPDEKWRALKQWTDVAASGDQGSTNYPSRKALLDLYSFFRTQFLSQEQLAPDGLLRSLLDAKYNDAPLSAREIMQFSMTLLLAGNETIASLLSNTLSILAADRDLWDSLRANRELVDPVITESLRYETPIQFVRRRVTQPVTIRSVEMKAGEIVILCLGAANRDPDVYSDPDRFEPQRQPAHHLAFSKGIHYCIGANLARLEATVMLNRMLDRYTSIERVGPGVRYPNVFFRGFKSLPLRLAA